MSEDRSLQLLEIPTRLETELPDQDAPSVLVAGERLCLPTGAIESEHQLRAEALSERLARDQRFELPDELGVPAERHFGLDPFLERRQAQLLEPGPLAPGERRGRELRERRPAPEPERLPQAVRRRLRPPFRQRRAPLGHETLEAVEVEVVGPELEYVAGRPCAQQSLRQHSAKLRHIPLNHLRRRRRNLLAPELVDQRLERERVVRVQEEQGEQRALSSSCERYRAAVLSCLKGSEDPELHPPSASKAPSTLARSDGGENALTEALPAVYQDRVRGATRRRTRWFSLAGNGRAVRPLSGGGIMLERYDHIAGVRIPSAADRFVPDHAWIERLESGPGPASRRRASVGRLLAALRNIGDAKPRCGRAVHPVEE